VKLRSRFALCACALRRSGAKHVSPRTLLIEWPKGEPAHQILAHQPRPAHVVRRLSESRQAALAYQQITAISAEIALDIMRAAAGRFHHHGTL